MLKVLLIRHSAKNFSKTTPISIWIIAQQTNNQFLLEKPLQYQLESYPKSPHIAWETSTWSQHPKKIGTDHLPRFWDELLQKAGRMAHFVRVCLCAERYAILRPSQVGQRANVTQLSWDLWSAHTFFVVVVFF